MAWCVREILAHFLVSHCLGVKTWFFYTRDSRRCVWEDSFEGFFFLFAMLANDPRQHGSDAVFAVCLRNLRPISPFFLGEAIAKLSFQENRLKFPRTRNNHYLTPCGRARSEKIGEKKLKLKLSAALSPPPFWFLVFSKKKECFLLALRYSFISILRDIPEQLKTGDMFRWHNAGAIKKRLPFTCVQIQGIS